MPSLLETRCPIWGPLPVLQSGTPVPIGPGSPEYGELAWGGSNAVRGVYTSPRPCPCLVPAAVPVQAESLAGGNLALHSSPASLGFSFPICDLRIRAPASEGCCGNSVSCHGCERFAYCVPDVVLVIYLPELISPPQQACCYPQVTDGETEAQRG